jgi:hypothetical protein
MSLVSDITKPNCHYTYYHDSMQRVSSIDYFMISNNIIGQMMHYSVLDNMLNFSDHLPISLKLDLLVEEVESAMLGKGEQVGMVPQSAPRLRWDKANLSAYYSLSYCRLEPLMRDVDKFISNHVSVCSNSYLNMNCEPILLRCQLVNIRPLAQSFIESAYTQLISILQETAEASVPKLYRSTLKHWWNDELNALKQQSIESNKYWVEAGKPTSGIIAEAMKNDKYAYKLAIKFRKAESDGVTASLCETLTNRDSNSFWQV